MLGAFIQTNIDSPKAKSVPIGYVIQESGCWEWTGSKTQKGYGQAWNAEKKRIELAHRWVWEQTNGPIPSGYEFHHACANKPCVNPAHLELVTPKEHYDRDGAWREGRQAASQANGARIRAKTHCPWGHPYSGNNLYVYADGRRRCRECGRRRNPRQRARKSQQGEKTDA